MKFHITSKTTRSSKNRVVVIVWNNQYFGIIKLIKSENFDTFDSTVKIRQNHARRMCRNRKKKKKKCGRKTHFSDDSSLARIHHVERRSAIIRLNAPGARFDSLSGDLKFSIARLPSHRRAGVQ